MKKLTSTFPNMLLSLGLICLIMGGILGFTYDVTQKPIEKADLNTKTAALEAVLPAFDKNENPLEHKQVIGLPGDGKDSVTIYTAKKDNKIVGYAIETFTKNGFSGRFDLMVGITPDAKIVDYSVLKHSETPGLGAKMQEWFRTPSSSQTSIRDFRGLDLAQETPLSVSKDGGKVDAITASTITSRAFIDAIQRAYKAFEEIKKSPSAAPEEAPLEQRDNHSLSSDETASPQGVLSTETADKK